MSFLVLLSAMALGGDAPEISRSVGEPGGVVVLWPRVIPRAEDGVGRNAGHVLDGEMKRIAADVAGTRPVDVRPEPERVCPQAGCKGVAFGAVLVHHGESCIAVATISLPGRSAQVLVPWVGQVELKQAAVPFREPPESSLTIKDFSRCAGLKEALTAGEEPVKKALAEAIAAAPEDDGHHPDGNRLP